MLVTCGDDNALFLAWKEHYSEPDDVWKLFGRFVDFDVKEAGERTEISHEVGAYTAGMYDVAYDANSDVLVIVYIYGLRVKARALRPNGEFVDDGHLVPGRRGEINEDVHVACRGETDGTPRCLVTWRFHGSYESDPRVRGAFLDAQASPMGEVFDVRVHNYHHIAVAYDDSGRDRFLIIMDNGHRTNPDRFDAKFIPFEDGHPRLDEPILRSIWLSFAMESSTLAIGQSTRPPPLSLAYRSGADAYVLTIHFLRPADARWQLGALSIDGESGVSESQIFLNPSTSEFQTYADVDANDRFWVVWQNGYHVISSPSTIHFRRIYY